MTHQYPDPEESVLFTRYASIESHGGNQQNDASSAVDHTNPKYFDDGELDESEQDFEQDSNNDLEVIDYSSAGESAQEQNLEPILQHKLQPTQQSRGLGRGIVTRSLARNGGRQTRKATGRGGKGIKRGLRNPVEPTAEFKILHSEATMAFIAHDYEKAESFILQALQMNPEMYVAHSLLSEIHAARGDADKALTAAWNGAHTRPRDIQMWSRIARLISERSDGAKDANLRDAIYCYTRIISVDRTNLEARFRRAALNRELGFLRKAAAEYEKLLKLLPNDTAVLRLLADLYLELKEPHRALSHYKEAIVHIRVAEPMQPTNFAWSDVNIIAELHDYQKSYNAGILQIRALSRWLLGRASESFWDDYTEDDREWDIEDEPRRVQLAQFAPNENDQYTYGEGLPLELRVKLGVFRLRATPANVEEAMTHFEWLEPDNDQGDGTSSEFADLFQETAKALFQAGLYSEALRFYEPLRSMIDHLDEACLKELMTCYTTLGMPHEVEKLAELSGFEQAWISIDANTAPAPMPDIPVLGEHLHKDSALKLATPSSEEQIYRGFLTKVIPASAVRDQDETQSTAKHRTNYTKKPATAKDVFDSDDLAIMYTRRQHLASTWSQAESTISKDTWMVISKRMIECYKSRKIISPNDRPEKTIVSGEGPDKINVELQQSTKDCARRSQIELGAVDEFGPGLVDEFAGISISKWLDIFLEYALELARQCRYEEAYRVALSARDENNFSRSPSFMFLIHVCWFTCALLKNDDESLCNIARWFMREYQFVSDGYRLFSALNKLCDSSHIWFKCSASQKYLLRQVKAVDFSLVTDACKKRFYQEKASYTTRDGTGNLVAAEEIDVALLMLYGYVLYAGKSYAYAVNYFLRAMSGDPQNPVIQLSLALAYIHHALKRQAENRHHLLVQGLALMLQYQEHRQGTGNTVEEQESCYNFGRTFHLLGLTHLAIPFYDHCLGLSRGIRVESGEEESEDFAVDAALALQSIWAASGHIEKAQEVTEKWLQL